MSHFDLYAAYYDLFYRDKDYQGEVEYLQRLAVEAGKGGGLGSRVLDLGCGTGRHAVLLAERAVEVVGLDVSESMIALARERARRCKGELAARLSFEIGDVRTFRSPRPFDSVVSLFHVLSYQVTNRDQDAFFETARRNLGGGGLLIFDFWYGPAVLIDRPKDVTRRVESGEIRATRRTTSRLRVNDNRVDVRFDIEVERLGTGDTERFSEEHHMRYIFLPEIEQRLQAHGFQLVATRKWLSPDAPGEESWNGCVVAMAS